MDSKLDKISSDLDGIKADIVEIKVSQAEMKKDISHHIMRTGLLEESVDLLRADVRPLQIHVARVSGAMKLLTLLATLLGLVAVAKKLGLL